MLFSDKSFKICEVTLCAYIREVEICDVCVLLNAANCGKMVLYAEKDSNLWCSPIYPIFFLP